MVGRVKASSGDRGATHKSGPPPYAERVAGVFGWHAGHQSHDGGVGEKRRGARRGHEAIGRRELSVHAGAITAI